MKTPTAPVRGTDYLDARAQASAPNAGTSSVEGIADGLLRFATPLRLAAAQLVAAIALLVLILGTPTTEGFQGLINATSNEGAHTRLALFREALAWVPGVDADGGPFHVRPGVHAWGVRTALAALALLHVAAFAGCLRGRRAPLWQWLVGPAVTSLILLPFPPLSADVFYYAISGDIAASGGNPHLSPPEAFPNSPLLPYNDWTDITSPYGPLWTSMSRAVIAVTGTDPVRAALAFKALAGLAAVGLALLVYDLARRVTGEPRRAKAAAVLVAWQPALLIESAGTAHNDALMMLVALAGLLVLSLPQRGAMRAGLVLIALSALIKYVTLPLLGLAALWRLRDRERSGMRAVCRQWSLDLAAVAAVVGFAFSPYWSGRRTISSVVEEAGRVFSNPIWLLPRLGVARLWDGSAGDAFASTTLVLTQVATALLAVGVAAWLASRMWRMQKAVPAEAILPLQVGAWATMMVVLMTVPVNVHSWYAIWSIGPVALAWTSHRPRSKDGLKASSPAVPRWLGIYLTWSALLLLIYHTRVVH